MYYQQQRPQFQSTQPSQAVTIVKSKHNGKHYLFQSTQPSQAVTKGKVWKCFSVLISIHTALAGCDPSYRSRLSPRHISIHTALAGCDLDLIPYTFVLCIFQSTQPSQAVTSHTIFLMFPQNISIHTALAGCDLTYAGNVLQIINFNPHSPRRLWHFRSNEKNDGANISIHTALAGCDAQQVEQGDTIIISIHTALAGCDCSGPKKPCRITNFNPHSPRRLWPNCYFVI